LVVNSKRVDLAQQAAGITGLRVGPETVNAVWLGV